MPIDSGHLTQPPSPSALLRAFVRPIDRNRPHHRVLDAAAALAECHARRYAVIEEARDPAVSSARILCLIDEIDRERSTQMTLIDTWVATNLAHRAGASLHTETLGAVIDRMARKWIAAQHALDGDPEGRTHLHWSRLAELADGYRDLITDVIEHRRRLPVW
ncbi:DUF4254 domain-containing protein [Nocardia caishijiensis]|uniref:Uncharacterized protein DUF4254 n=1 Tax=Nocardia caishijiensis TaxID=184756 RepID=A0ABQ6YJI4_9NOCA|nr:DUF4254 domain-containing protein [Nocardia caishijiensis]KAF0845962.1 uncharacterized protein DUF4254 [Nocardia caishijiensis]